MESWKLRRCIIKGILHQTIFYRLNLIIWIVMGCGIARFGRKGLKTTETWKFWSQNLSPGVLRRGAPGVSRHGAMGFRGAAQGFRGAAPWGFEGRRHGVSRGGATDKRLQWFIIWRCPSRSLVIRWDLEGQREMINHWSLLSVALPLETPWRCPSKPLGAAPRNPCAAPRNPMALCLETPGAPRLKTPGDKFWDQNFQVSVVFRPLRLKRAIPHPITIQNMRFRR